jgi:5-methylcytosine-specific restriction endonuclease McrA
MTLDHLRRACDGGSNNERNLVLACRDCNNDRGMRDEWAAHATRQIYCD